MKVSQDTNKTNPVRLGSPPLGIKREKNTHKWREYSNRSCTLPHSENRTQNRQKDLTKKSNLEDRVKGLAF